MLNGRLYRAAFLPFVFALAIAAFSLTGRPSPLHTTLAPDAFEGQRAFSELTSLAPELDGSEADRDPRPPRRAERGRACRAVGDGRAARVGARVGGTRDPAHDRARVDQRRHRRRRCRRWSTRARSCAGSRVPPTRAPTRAARPSPTARHARPRSARRGGRGSRSASLPSSSGARLVSSEKARWPSKASGASVVCSGLGRPVSEKAAIASAKTKGRNAARYRRPLSIL